MRTVPPTRLDRLGLDRIALFAGVLAGAGGGALSLLLVVLRSALRDLPPLEPLQARAEALLGAGAPVGGAMAGALLHPLAGALLGALFGWRVRLRSGLELAMRGVAFAVASWSALALLLLLAAPGGAHAAPSLAEAVVFGVVLGARARITRVLLRRSWRRAPA